jgi:hypothetical protein
MLQQGDKLASSTTVAAHARVYLEQLYNTAAHPLAHLLLHCSGPWPSTTVRLPNTLSQAGNIYRAQVLVTPQWGYCEEFWALNPSGKQTGAKCEINGIGTGEPYREVG